MDILIGLIILVLVNILVMVLPALMAGWLFTLVLPVSFGQVVWLAVGVLLVVRYIILTIADIPGENETGLLGAAIGAVVSLLLLALSGLLGWLLLRIFSLDLSMFEAVSLFAISLTAGTYFTFRWGTGGMPLWMTALEPVEDDDLVIPAKKPRKRKSRTGH